MLWEHAARKSVPARLSCFALHAPLRMKACLSLSRPKTATMPTSGQAACRATSMGSTSSVHSSTRPWSSTPRCGLREPARTYTRAHIAPHTKPLFPFSPLPSPVRCLPARHLGGPHVPGHRAHGAHLRGEGRGRSPAPAAPRASGERGGRGGQHCDGCLEGTHTTGRHRGVSAAEGSPERTLEAHPRRRVGPSG